MTDSESFDRLACRRAVAGDDASGTVPVVAWIIYWLDGMMNSFSVIDAGGY
jgi:hypothetical protein